MHRFLQVILGRAESACVRAYLNTGYTTQKETSNYWAVKEVFVVYLVAWVPPLQSLWCYYGNCLLIEFQVDKGGFH